MRKYLQLRLRTLFVVVLLLSLTCGWYMSRVAPQRAAIKEILALGGDVSYEPMDQPPLGTDTSLFGRLKTFIATKFGNDWVYDPQEVFWDKHDRLDNRAMLISAFDALKRLPSINRVWFCTYTITSNELRDEASPRLAEWVLSSADWSNMDGIPATAIFREPTIPRQELPAIDGTLTLPTSPPSMHIENYLPNLLRKEEHESNH